MNDKHYVVTITGQIFVDTTVAVIAASESEAAQRALDGVHCKTLDWYHSEVLSDDPVVSDVSLETRDELDYADQRHLLGQP